MNPDPFADYIMPTSQRGVPKIQVAQSDRNLSRQNEESLGIPIRQENNIPSSIPQYKQQYNPNIPKSIPQGARPKQENQNDPFAEYIQDNAENISQIPKTDNMSWWDKNFTKEGQQAKAQENRDFLKSMVSGATVGLSEYFDILKPKEENGVGNIIGTFLPIGLTAKAIAYPFKLITNAFKFGSKATKAVEIGKHAATGLTYGTEKEVSKAIRGQEVDYLAPVEEAALFAGIGAGIDILKASPKIASFVENLFPKQRMQMLVDGYLPENLSPAQYKFWQNEVAPEWMEKAKSNYEFEYSKAKEANDLAYQKELNQAKVEHERDLYNTEQDNAIANDRYQYRVRQIESDHASKTAEIEAQNRQAQIDYEEAERSYQELMARQNAVEEATILRPEESELPYRQAPSNETKPSLKNEVGNVVSPNEITNSTNAGKANIEAVRANDQVDYRNVNQAYDRAKELGAAVETVHPNLAMDLLQERNILMQRIELTPPQQQKLDSINKILDRIAVIGPEGTIIKLNPVSNNILEEEAKALRYYMDFHFEHGTARGILSPLTTSIEDSIIVASEFTGHGEAATANRHARNLYRQWAEDYDNPFLRKYRDNRKFDFSDTFKNSLHVDEFNALNNILQRSNAGQQLSNATRRALVEKNLGKFLDNPHGTNPIEFQEALNELSPVLSQEETSAIRQNYRNARNQPPFVPKKPEAPETKEPPKLKTPLAPEKKVIKETKIPLKKPVSPNDAMKLASQQMDMSIEKIRSLSNTPTGLKQLKANTSPATFKRIGEYKVKDILYKGNVKYHPKGRELADTINKVDNYDMLVEILGENETADLLQAAEKLGGQDVTVESVKKLLKKGGTLGLLVNFGII